jgi:hypothetical protein
MMTYTTSRLENQTLMFKITTKHNGEEISFNVVCANDESEIPALVEFYINFLDAPPPVYPQQAPTPDLNALVQEQQAAIQELKAQVDALKGAQNV